MELNFIKKHALKWKVQEIVKTCPRLYQDDERQDFLKLLD